MKQLNCLFAGTPLFAKQVLEELLSCHHNIIAVYTQPDRQAGRGRKVKASEVKTLAVSHELPIYQPVSLKNEAENIKALKPDVIIVVAYGLFLPQSILDIAPCINVHPSLLPRWRGAAPVQRAILNNDQRTGVSIMAMNQRLDAGPVYSLEYCDIDITDNGETLSNKLADLGAKMLISVLDNFALGTLTSTLQDENFVTYAEKINKAEAIINWSQSATDIHCKIRAFNPTPVAFTYFNHEAIRIYQADIFNAEHDEMPGTILNCTKNGVDVACGEGLLRINEMQFPGGKKLSSHDIYNGKAKILQQGYQFENQ